MNTISNSQDLFASHFLSLIFKFIFVFLLSMQALRQSGCWGGNSAPIFLLVNDENYAFIGIK